MEETGGRGRTTDWSNIFRKLSRSPLCRSKNFLQPWSATLNSSIQASMKARQNVKSARSVFRLSSACLLFSARARPPQSRRAVVLTDLARYVISIGQVGARCDARAGQERDRCQARVDPDGE